MENKDVVAEFDALFEGKKLVFTQEDEEMKGLAEIGDVESKIRHVATQAGVDRFHAPIGSPIIGTGAGRVALRNIKIVPQAKNPNRSNPKWTRVQSANGRNFDIGYDPTHKTWVAVEDDSWDKTIVDHAATQEEAFKLLDGNLDNKGNPKKKFVAGSQKSGAKAPAGTPEKAPAAKEGTAEERTVAALTKAQQDRYHAARKDGESHRSALMTARNHTANGKENEKTGTIKEELAKLGEHGKAQYRSSRAEGLSPKEALKEAQDWDKHAVAEIAKRKKAKATEPVSKKPARKENRELTKSQEDRLYDELPDTLPRDWFQEFFNAGDTFAEALRKAKAKDKASNGGGSGKPDAKNVKVSKVRPSGTIEVTLDGEKYTWAKPDKNGFGGGWRRGWSTDGPTIGMSAKTDIRDALQEWRSNQGKA